MIFRTNAKRFVDRLSRRVTIFMSELLWKSPRTLRRIIIGNSGSVDLTIALQTYIERFDSCFKPFVTRLAELFPTQQIMVVANGHFDKLRQLDYIKDLREFCAHFPNIDLKTHVEPVSISKMSNYIFLNAKSDVILFCNDDLRMALGFPGFLLSSGSLTYPITVINGSWSCLVLSKTLIRKLGYSDERMPEIGGEDDDYAARCALAGVNIQHLSTKTVGSSGKKTQKRDTMNSWGRDMRKQRSGYSDLNSEFLLQKKWIVSSEPFEGAVHVPNRAIPYWKLREGMETPDFYPESGFLKGSEVKD